MLKKFWKARIDFSDDYYDQLWNISTSNLTPAQDQTLWSSELDGLSAIDSRTYGISDLGLALVLFRQMLLQIKAGIKNLWKAYWTDVTDLGRLDVYVYHRPEGQHRGY